MTETQNIPWKRIVVEVFAIVASILFAFGIDAWWEYRIEREVEREVLANLLIEFERNRVELDRTLDTLTGSQNAAKRLLMFAGKSLTGDDNAVIEQKLDELFYFTFDPPSGALESLMSAGQLNLILNTELRMRIAGWSGLVKDYKEDEEELDYLIYRDLVPIVYAINPLPNVEDAAPGFFQSQWQEAFKDVRFMNSIGNVSYWIESSIEEASLLGGEIDQIVTLIKIEIE